MHRRDNHLPATRYSEQLDSVAHAYPCRFNAIAIAAKLLEASADLTLGNSNYLETPYTVQSLLKSKLTQHFFASRLTSYEILLLVSPPNLHLKSCKVLNPASILPLPD